MESYLNLYSGRMIHIPSLGASGTSYTEVNTYGDLPDPTTVSGKIYIVLTTTGTWFLGTKRKSGFYKSDGISWNYLDASEFYRAGVSFIVGTGDQVISTGVKGYVEIPFICDIQAVRLLGDVSGSIEFDIQKTTYTSFPSGFSSIVSAAPPTISAAQKSEDTTLTGWTITLNEGDILRISVSSVTNIQRCTLILKLIKQQTS
jgi:hypothetical protein